MKYLYPCMPNPVAPGYLDRFEKDINWVAEVKKNGWRCLVERDSQVTLWTRHRTTINEPVPDLREALADLLVPGTVLDGEFIHYRTKGVKGVLYVFDILAYSREYLYGEPFRVRREILEAALKNPPPQIEIAAQARIGKKSLYHRSIEGDLNEGIVLKRLDSVYPVSDKRCQSNPFWLKAKKVEDHVKVKTL